MNIFKKKVHIIHLHSHFFTQEDAIKIGERLGKDGVRAVVVVSQFSQNEPVFVKTLE